MPAFLVLDSISLATPDGRPLFDGLTLAQGRERTGLVGRNGCGKSTLLRLIAGEIRRFDGTVAQHLPLFGGFAGVGWGNACGFCWISCSTSRCSFTSTSWRIVTLRLISIGFSGVLTEMQLARGNAARPAAATLRILILWVMVISRWQGLE